MALLWRSFLLQLHVIRTNPDYFLGLAIAPLSAVIFLSVVRSEHSRRFPRSFFAP